MSASTPFRSVPAATVSPSNETSQQSNAPGFSKFVTKHKDLVMSHQRSFFLFYCLTVPELDTLRWMLCEFKRSSHTFTLPSFPDDTRHVRMAPPRFSTVWRDVVPSSCPGSVCTPRRLLLSKISITFDGNEAEAA